MVWTIKCFAWGLCIDSSSEIFNILIIDDNPDDREIYKRLLAKADFRKIQFFEAASGARGLELISSKKIECVLLDYNLPDVTGLEVLSQIVGVQKTDEKLPVIMLTGQGNENVAVEVMKLGATDYAVKDNLTAQGLQRIVANGFEKVLLQHQLEKQKMTLKQANQDLKYVNQKLVQASDAKSEFLATMSHEMRTPLNSILGVTDLILDESVNSRIREYVSMQQRSGEVLLTLINDILDISRIEEGKLELDNADFEFTEVLTSCMNMMKFRVEDKGLDFQLIQGKGIPKYLKGDPDKLKQILTNLIGNSQKFTENGGIDVGVTLKKISEDHCQLLFSVSDTGIGIPEESLGRIFQGFEQSNNAISRVYGGTGLGLTICRDLVGLMGGRIWVESVLGKGSTFFFTAQFGRPQDLRVNREEPIKKILLLVEDEPLMQKVTAKQLEPLGLEVLLASNGAEALRMFRSEQVDAILADIKMPVMDGLELYSEIQGMKIKIPFIFMSAHYCSKDVDRALKVSDIKVFTKPFLDGGVLCKAVGEAVDIGFQSRENRSQLHQLNNLTALKVLLIDDSAENVTLIRFFLRDAPYQIEVAENGLIGLEKFKSGDCDLVLMDMRMPVMNGLEATEKIRLWEVERGSKAIPIIGLSANESKEDVERCKLAGCTEFLTKPVKKATLMDCIQLVTRVIRVLVVEDEGEIRKLLEDYLRTFEYDVYSASNGQGGMKICREQNIDVVLTDILMPEKDGLELIKELSRDFPKVKIMAVSANIYELEAAKVLGAHITMAKPFCLEEINDAIKELLQ